ncbi:MAG: hypothetical protein ICV73_10690 [Acetobacteraceae bacterium]|nr:hypothetical protein [Acetobacteraceae bacterium]
MSISGLDVATAAAQPAAPWPERPPFERTYRGITFRIPADYLEVAFADTGFVIRAFADDLRPYGPGTAPDFPRDALRAAVRISVGGQLRFPGHDWVRRGIQIHAGSDWHQPAEAADRLDGPGGAPVPAGLRYRMALPWPAQASGTREDMFVPEEARRSAAGAPLPEAIFCLSPNAPIVQRGTAATGLLGCAWELVWRDFNVKMSLDRRHLARWREVRDGALALLDSLVVAGPAEALPPPKPPTDAGPKGDQSGATRLR